MKSGKLLIHPGQDNIEAYIRDVKEAAHQLNYNDEAVLHLIKATMLPIYGTLYKKSLSCKRLEKLQIEKNWPFRIILSDFSGQKLGKVVNPVKLAILSHSE